MAYAATTAAAFEGRVAGAQLDLLGLAGDVVLLEDLELDASARVIAILFLEVLFQRVFRCRDFVQVRGREISSDLERRVSVNMTSARRSNDEIQMVGRAYHEIGLASRQHFLVLVTFQPHESALALLLSLLFVL